MSGDLELGYSPIDLPETEAPVPQISFPAYGGLPRRFMALLVDVLVIFVLAIPAHVIWGNRSDVIWITGLIPVYFILGYFSGGTLGHRAMGIRVLSMKTFRKMNLLQGIVRFIGFFLQLSYFFPLLLSALFNWRRRGLHDYLARTICVRVRLTQAEHRERGY